MVTAIESAKEEYCKELSEAAGALASNCTKLLEHRGPVYGNVIDGGHLWISDHTIGVNPDLSGRDDPNRLEKIDPYLAKNLLLNLSAEFSEADNN